MNLLLAAVLLLQDKTAEEAFKKIEETILQAKSITLSYKISGTSLDQQHTERKSEASGTLLLKAPNQAYLQESSIVSGGRRTSRLIVSDGSSMVIKRDPPWDQERPRKAAAPHMLNERLKAALLWLGASSPFDIGSGMIEGRAEKEDFDPVKEFRLESFQTGPHDGNAQTLAFRAVSIKYPTVVSRFTLGYDLKSFRLLKRSQAMKWEQIEISSTEAYDEFTLNADIPDEKFKLPEEKK